MKKIIAVILTCLMILPFATLPALAADGVRVEIPSDVAGLTVEEFKNKINTGLEVDHIEASVYTNDVMHDYLNGYKTLEEGQFYYISVLLIPKSGYELPKYPNLFNMTFHNGDGVTVTHMEVKNGCVSIKGTLLVNGGSTGNRIKNVFNRIFSRIKALFWKFFRDLKDIGKEDK